jgi:hypothetical protein
MHRICKYILESTFAGEGNLRCVVYRVDLRVCRRDVGNRVPINHADPAASVLRYELNDSQDTTPGYIEGIFDWCVPHGDTILAVAQRATDARIPAAPLLSDRALS